jgi:DNA polymerase-3 subunit epsilon
MVLGHRLNAEIIQAFASTSALVIAHNAAFDRPFVEKALPFFCNNEWACTMANVPWKEEGFESRKLSELLSKYGFFFDSHRAANDCLATVELLGQWLPKSGRTVMSALLEAARSPSYIITAISAPFECKDVLKARNYKWNPGNAGETKGWFIEVGADQFASELQYLQSEIYRRSVELPIKIMTGYQRFSSGNRFANFTHVRTSDYPPAITSR